MSAIIPGILEQDWAEIEKKLEILKPFAKTVHIDLLDGTFTDNSSFLDPEPFKKYSEFFDFELHMMVDNPLQYVQPFSEAGFTRFIGHVEMMPNQVEFVAEAEAYGEVGLALDARTPAAEITVSYENIDFLLMMTVKAGYSGQEYLRAAEEKIRRVRAKHPLLLVEVDGGITPETLPLAYASGAGRFVATSAIFGSSDPEAAFTELSEIVAKAAEQSVLLE